MAKFIEFRLLGPLEVVADGKIVEVGSARQRIVLSMLLLQANQVVPLGRLVDAVWADTPPATSKSQIQTCISALRGQLAADGGCVIETRTVGYAILVPEHAVDVGRFQQLASRGRAAAADDRGADAVLDLRAALDLWRGPAADGVDSKLVQAVTTRLNEDRVSVLEECIGLELTLGRHHDLTGELSELVKQYPLREKLRAQHMLALYRSGRQAEALESFREARHLFIEELGLDLGEDLRALERAILVGDPALDIAPQPAPAGPVPARGAAAAVPRQLTAAIADFTGRAELRESLIELLSAGEPDVARYLPVAVLTGKAGAGKTALALDVAHDVRPGYPDGQLFAQLRDADGEPVSPLELHAQFLGALGLASAALPDGLAERTALFRTVVGDRRMLIVLDNADSVSQVLPLLPGCPNCAVIITSRQPLPGVHGARHFEVNELDEQASIDLLARVIGPDRVKAEAAAALALVRLSGCLPLALRIVAAKLASRAHWSIDKMTRRMTDERQRLDELVLGDVGLRSTLSQSYRRLGPDAQRLFRRLSLTGAADFPAWVSAPLLDRDAEAASDVLDDLIAARLVEVRVTDDGPPRFRLDDLTRIYAAECLAEEPAAERGLVLRRLLGCWLWLAGQAHRRSYGGDFAVLHSAAARWELPGDVADQLLEQPLSWFRAEQAGLVSAVRQAAQAGLDELCWDLAVTSVTLFESEYHVDDWRMTHETALAAVRRAGNRRGEAAILCSLGNLAVGERLGEAARYLNPALRIFEEIGDAHGRALTLATLAFVDRLAGRHDQALARYLEVLGVFRAVGDRVGEIDALTNVAQIELDRDRFELVEEFFARALMLCQSLQAPRIVAQTEYRRGEFFLRQGDLGRAEQAFRFVLQLVGDERDLVGEVYALQSLGIVHTRQQQYDLAEADLSAALRASRLLGDNLVHGRVLLAYTEFYLAKKELDQASSLIDEALVVFSGIGQAAVWRARFLELTARRDDQTGRASAPVAARRAAFELARDSDPALARALAFKLRMLRLSETE